MQSSSIFFPHFFFPDCFIFLFLWTQYFRLPFYTFCGIFIVLSSYFIIRYDNDSPASRELTLLYLILIALISTIFTVLIGGAIDYFHIKYQNFPDKMNPIKRFTKAFLRHNFSLFLSCIVAQIPVSFADRLISTFARLWSL